MDTLQKLKKTFGNLNNLLYLCIMDLQTKISLGLFFLAICLSIWGKNYKNSSTTKQDYPETYLETCYWFVWGVFVLIFAGVFVAFHITLMFWNVAIISTFFLGLTLIIRILFLVDDLGAGFVLECDKPAAQKEIKNTKAWMFVTLVAYLFSCIFAYFS